MFSVRSHLGNINGKKLNDEIDLSGPLNSDGSIDLSILIGNARLGERGVFKFDIELSVEGLNSSQSIHFSNELGAICVAKWRQKLRNANRPMSTAGANKRQSCKAKQ